MSLLPTGPSLKAQLQLPGFPLSPSPFPSAAPATRENSTFSLACPQGPGQNQPLPHVPISPHEMQASPAKFPTHVAAQPRALSASSRKIPGGEATGEKRPAQRSTEPAPLPQTPPQKVPAQQGSRQVASARTDRAYTPQLCEGRGSPVLQGKEVSPGRGHLNWALRDEYKSTRRKKRRDSLSRSVRNSRESAGAPGR